MEEVKDKLLEINPFARATSADGKGRMKHPKISRKNKLTNKEVVGFEIPCKIPAWESVRKNRKTLYYGMFGIFDFVRYNIRKDRGYWYVHKYSKAQQIKFIKTYLTLMIVRVIKGDLTISLPFNIGKFYLSKTNRIGRVFDKETKTYKRVLNLHTFRKFISLGFEKSTALNAPTVKFYRDPRIKWLIPDHYLHKKDIYQEALDKIYSEEAAV